MIETNKTTMFNLIIFGPPGSGKGTQSDRIAEKFNFAHISTGEIFRYAIKNKTPLGVKVEAIIDRGELVPDELTLKILEKAMGRASGNQGFVYDGFPRTNRQALEMDVLLNKTNDCINLVISLEVNQEEVVQRLLLRAQEQGRKDDTEAVIRNRMLVYHKQTSPLIEFYKNQDKLVPVHGVGTIDDIFKNISAIIDQHLA